MASIRRCAESSGMGLSIFFSVSRTDKRSMTVWKFASDWHRSTFQTLSTVDKTLVFISDVGKWLLLLRVHWVPRPSFEAPLSIWLVNMFKVHQRRLLFYKKKKEIRKELSNPSDLVRPLHKEIVTIEVSLWNNVWETIPAHLVWCAGFPLWCFDVEDWLSVPVIIACLTA